MTDRLPRAPTDDERLERFKNLLLRVGSAPGGYFGKCHGCGERFIGDKRAQLCEPCAVNRISELMHAGAAAEQMEAGVTDPNVGAVRRKIMDRAELGMKKYGVHTTTLTPMESLKHAQEEAMDLCVYLEQAIRSSEP